MNQDNFNGKNAENQGIIAMTAQKRIAEAVKFFDFLYDRVPTPTFIYLAKFKDKREFPAFSATDAKQRQAMAVKAIELNNSSVDIWHSVNPVSIKPSGGKRGDESAVAYQVAIVTDIDIRSDAHKSENLAADFDEAKSFLPFAPTILIHSGYGIQAYYVFETPIKITDENREECKRRNELFLDVIRARANGKTIDAVGDLPRILRTPGTFNYKLGTLNAPLCHIVDFSDVRFTPAEIDEKLAALPISATPSKPVDVDKSARNHRDIIDDSDFDIYRARRMLDFINPASLSYEDWFAVGAALKNVGCSCSDWEQWSKNEDRFKDGECQYKWDTFDRDGYGIGTLYNFAEQAGYDAKEIYREYADLHPDFARKRADRADVYSSPTPMDDDQTTDDGEITTKYYVKDCPVALTIPANFEFKNRGITQLIPDKKKPDEPKRVITTRTPIIPTKILREAKSGTVQYEIAIKSGDTWRKAIVSGRTINDSRAIIDLADYGALVEYPAALKSFFNSIIATNLTNGRLTSSKVYKMPGWHDGEFIYPQSTGDKIVMRDGIDYDSLFAVKGSRDTWHAKFEETCFNKGLSNSFGTNILLAQYIVGNALLAPALEILGLPNTQVHLWGARNSAKSPILKLAVSIYGNPTEGKLFRNFASTAKNRMTFAAGLCDLPLAIDELEAADKFDDLQGETYRFFGGTINQANKRDGRTREAEDFRGVRLMTGEHAFIEVDTAKGGAIKRVIQIQAKTPLMPEKRAHELHLFLADNFGHYGREWTKYLAEHKRELKEAFAVLKDKIANDDATPNCEATHIRAVLGAFFCFAIFNKIFGTNYVTTDDEWILLHTRKILRELPTLDEIDVAKRAIDYLSSYVDEHPRKFLTDSATYESQDEQKRKSEELDGIKYHDGKVAFFANAFKRVISKSGLPSYSAVLSELYEADALIAKNSREKSCRVYHPITQTRARVYLFKENILSISAKDYESEDDLP